MLHDRCSSEATHVTQDELTVHVEVLEARLAKLETALILLLDAMKSGFPEDAIEEVREVVASDLEEWE